MSEDKLHERMKLLADIPDFRNKVYDNPRELFNKYIEFTQSLDAHINVMSKIIDELIIKSSTFDKLALQSFALLGGMEEDNKAIEQLKISIQNTIALRNRVLEIIKNNFTDLLTFYDIRYFDVAFKQSNNSDVVIIDSKKDLLKYLKMTESDFDDLENSDIIQENVALLMNNLRFNNLKLKGALKGRTVLKFESYICVVELESDHWATIKY
jgi:hypothetical protein